MENEGKGLKTHWIILVASRVPSKSLNKATTKPTMKPIQKLKKKEAIWAVP